jgi:ferrous iron transport protein A
MADPKPFLPPLPLMQPLAAFAPGEGAVITAFAGGRKLQEHLLSLGLYPGKRLTVCQNYGSSLVVRLNGNRIALGRGVSQKILATPSPSTCHQHQGCHCARSGDDNTK